MNEIEKKLLKDLAQHAADTGAMFMPMSGFAMIGAMMLSKKAGEILGEEIKPTEKAFLGTQRMIDTIAGEYKEALEKVSKELEDLRMETITRPVNIVPPRKSVEKTVDFLRKTIRNREMIATHWATMKPARKMAQEEFECFDEIADYLESFIKE